MDLNEMLALIAAPIYTDQCQSYGISGNHTFTDAKIALRKKAVKEAEALWQAVLDRKKS